ACLYIEAEAVDAADPRGAATVTRLVERFGGAVLLGAAGRWGSLRRPSVPFEVRRPTSGEQHDLRKSLLGAAGARLNGRLPRFAPGWGVGAGAAGGGARGAWAGGGGGAGPAARLWDACRAQAQPRLEALALRIQPAATWDDLVLPEPEREAIREIAAQVAHR